MNAKVRLVFKRLERDSELRKRIKEEQRKLRIFVYGGEQDVTFAQGESLDRIASLYNLQRRIVEDVA